MYNNSMNPLLPHKHYKGYWQSRMSLMDMSDNDLLDLLDNLYGRNSLPVDYTHDDLLQEAIKQHEREWNIPERFYYDSD